jgi:hypothetical protein
MISRRVEDKQTFLDPEGWPCKHGVTYDAFRVKKCRPTVVWRGFFFLFVLPFLPNYRKKLDFAELQTQSKQS